MLATRTEHRTSFTNLVRDAADSSSVSTNTRQHTTTKSGPQTTGQGFSSSDSPGNSSQGLAWFGSEAHSNAVHVPIASFDTVKSAWALDATAAQQLNATINQVSPAGLAGILGEIPPQTVHVYAGSHIEAVAGHCLLSNIITDALSMQPPDEAERLESGPKSHLQIGST